MSLLCKINFIFVIFFTTSSLRNYLVLAGKIAQAAHDLGVQNVLLVPGVVHIPWRDDYEPVPNDICDRRAREAVKKLIPQVERIRHL